MNIIIMTSLGVGRWDYLTEAGMSIVSARDYALISPEKHFSIEWNIAMQDTGKEDIEAVKEAVREVEKYIPVKIIFLDSVVPACIGRNIIATCAPDNSLLINLDSDDELTKRRLEFVTEDTQVQVCAAVDYVIENENWIEKEVPGTTLISETRQAPWFENSFNGRLDFMMSSLAIRREVLLDCNGYPALPWAEDTVLASNISARGYDLEVVSTAGMRYRKHKNQTTKKNYDPHDIFSAWIPH